MIINKRNSLRTISQEKTWYNMQIDIVSAIGNFLEGIMVHKGQAGL